MNELLWNACLKATVVLALAWIATALLRRGSADLRHRIWVAALVGTALVALPWPVPRPAAFVITTNLTVAGTAGSEASRAISWMSAVWFVGFAVVLIRFAAGVIHLARLTRSATISGSVLVSDSIASPMTWGAVRPVILVPAYAMAWAEEKIEVVLRHERAHVARRDWLWQAFAQMLTALFWFHPLAWLAAARLRQEAEHAADDMVLASGSDAADYAGQLMEVAHRIRGGVPQAAVAVTMVRTSALTSRVASILDSSRTRMRAGVQARTLIAVAALCVVAFLAVCQHANAQVYRVEEGVTAPAVTYRVQPRYSEAARRAKWSGTVTVSLIVDAQGRPQNISVIKPLGLGLDEMAIEAVQQWKFKPGEKDGKPVPVQATIEINFRLL